jgi:hypothetical protein
MSKRKPAGWRAELWQGEMMVANVCGETDNDVKNEINHYAMIYEPDGPVSIILKPPAGRWQYPGARC